MGRQYQVSGEDENIRGGENDSGRVMKTHYNRRRVSRQRHSTANAQSINKENIQPFVDPPRRSVKIIPEAGDNVVKVVDIFVHINI